MAEKTNDSVKTFVELVKKSRRGKFKIYIGMSAGVPAYSWFSVLD
jgi:two-component system sensor histidine kinase KdpD